MTIDDAAVTAQTLDTADAGAAPILEGAWDRIPSSREATKGIGTFTRIRVERIISIAAGLGSLALGAQAFLAALGSEDELPGWNLPLLILVFAPLAVMVVACFVGRGVRISAGAFALVYVLALVLWPIASRPAEATSGEPWIWYLVTVASVAALLAFPLPLQIIWTILVPLLYGVVRMITTGFAPEAWIGVALDVSFALILGSLLLVLGWLFRSIAANVDETRARAVASYADAAATDAAEHERMALAALMHDSVLAALIAAERAGTPREKTLAAAMAREALTRLANTEQDPREGTDEPSDAATIATDLEDAAEELGARLPVALDTSEGSAAIPGRVARALTLAAAQAVANALQHAGGKGLGATVISDAGGVEIEVRDTGEGFDPLHVPNDRLGIKASIIARVAAVGGVATVETGPHGTTVRLVWREGSL